VNDDDTFFVGQNLSLLSFSVRSFFVGGAGAMNSPFDLFDRCILTSSLFLNLRSDKKVDPSNSVYYPTTPTLPMKPLPRSALILFLCCFYGFNFSTSRACVWFERDIDMFALTAAFLGRFVCS